MADAPVAAPPPTAPPAPTTEGAEKDVKEGLEAPKKAPPPPPKTPERRKITVDGVDEEVDVEETLKNHQKWRAGDKMLKEAAQAKKQVQKQVQEFMKQLKENPRAILSNPKLGIDFRKIAEEHLREEIEKEMEDPRDSRLKELEAREAERLEADTEAKTKKEQEEYDGHVSAQREEIAGKIHEVLKGTVLAKDSATLGLAAYYMKQCLMKGVEVTPAQVISHLENTHLVNLRNTGNQYDGEQLANYLGPDIIKKLRAHDLAELRKARGLKNETKVRKDSPEPGERSKAPQFFDRHSMAEAARKKLMGS